MPKGAGRLGLPVLGRRALNRATLARQLLLGRVRLPALAAVERLAGLNAQDPPQPSVSLWSRLDGYCPEVLAGLLHERTLVRSSLMRATQHLVTAEDFLAWRGILQPVLDRTWRGHFVRPTGGLPEGELAAAGRALLAGRPRTRRELRDVLAARWPGADPVALAWSVQLLVAIVHPPTGHRWGWHGETTLALAEDWLGRQVPASGGSVDELVRRYLTAFGPATVADVQAWSGLTRLREVVDRLRPELRTFRDEAGRELFDPPDAPRPHPDAPAPVRFLPVVDNLLVAHADRSRFMTEAQRQRVCVEAGVGATVLVDGTVAGMWSVTRRRGATTMAVEPLTGLAATARAAVAAEGVRLLAFLAPDAAGHEVRFTDEEPPPR